MPTNNNQKVPSAAARVAKLPIVSSVCSKLLVLYTDTKRSHPNLKSVCEVLENSVTGLGSAACDRVSPVIVKLEPQISIANDVACKSLDWLETTFPVIHTPTEEVVASAKSKIHEIQDAVSVTANGTMDCVHHTVTWMMERMQQADDGTNKSFVKRAITVASVGLDSALSMSEAMVDQVLPPTEEDKKEDTSPTEGFEAPALQSYPERVIFLTAKLFRRTYYMLLAKMQSVQVQKIFPWSSSLILDLQTTSLRWVWNIQELPQYLQHQVVTVFFFFSQMYYLCHPPTEQNQLGQVRSHLNTASSSSYKDVVQVYPHGVSPCRTRKPIKMSIFDNGCNVKASLRR